MTPRRRTLRLALTATAGGAFSGLFGIGGGTVIVPLLIVWFGYRERVATGTSLCAIAIIGALAAAAHGLHGNVDVKAAALVGVPAVAGVVVGAALQQRLPERVVAAIFALVLVASAVKLALG
ncbi:sulfite exporter TauE/SafE family protein [Thermoleophilum album]|uniref:sulfite exporter TauE/SafE family protein n=1 Tax=Thermoleophilum album TaxID=29539 RepID=UPI00237C5D7F|nr:sulfite exporter TauE/SafE family protein [Thermoleophilum album]WDT93597.1 sulfite exporter TauE/SafE family protein [Thermoleophilum album]